MKFLAVIVVLWAQSNPAAPRDRSAVIWKHEFATEIKCMDALAEQMNRAHETYGEIKAVTIIGDCARQ